MNKPFKQIQMNLCITITKPQPISNLKITIPLWNRFLMLKNSLIKELLRISTKKPKCQPEKELFTPSKKDLLRQFKPQKKVCQKMATRKSKTSSAELKNKKKRKMPRNTSIHNSLKNIMNKELHSTKKVKQFLFR